MDASDRTFSELVGVLKSWIPWRSESANVSRDFWMPDQSCRVCYDCDSQFTIINRRHHCRLCGRVFCTRCTSNSIPAPTLSPDPTTTNPAPNEDSERIRVCNFCFKQWEQGVVLIENGTCITNQDLCRSPSASSFASTRSSGTAYSSCITVGSTPCSIGTCQRAQENSGLSPQLSGVTGQGMDWQCELTTERSDESFAVVGDPSPSQYTFSINRSDNEDDEYGVYQSDNEARDSPKSNGYHGQAEDGSYRAPSPNAESSSLLHTSFESQALDGPTHTESKEDEGYIGEESEASSSLYAVAEEMNSEPVDFENNGLLWIPPEPEDEEDDKEALLLDDDDGGGDATGEWGYLRSSSFGSGEYRSRDRSGEEHKKAMKNVVDGHFRALISQLLQVENLPMGKENDEESWLEIITSLSWEAATLLKPDMSKGGGMDPGGYVKIKCIASGCCSNSMVVKGVVCKKNVAHRRMTSRIEKPRLLILGGALEYQRVSNHLSSFDTLLQQEIDHLKMAVAKIDAQHPNVLLVEKSVSRHAQEYLLAKDISLVLNIKRPLLERIARCTGAQIASSIDHLSAQKVGYCESFHVDKFLEDLGTAGQSGKKLVKTLMFFEGCPRPLGCTIILKGANGDELKKVKRVVQFGVFAAYHLALETSFLADEGATLPELPLNSPITVALPDKSSSIERSISMVPGFSIPANAEPRRSSSFPMSDLPSLSSSVLPHLPNYPVYHPTQSTLYSTNFASKSNGRPFHSFEGNDMGNQLAVSGFGPFNQSREGEFSDVVQNHHGVVIASQLSGSQIPSLQENGQNHQDEQGSTKEEPRPLKEEFPPSPSDHQSILVSLSSRCVWKGTVCERSHLFRIKYYGSFDKPLGRFLQDHLFDQSYRCHSCEMPSEAHVYCYTHRQGTLTISVKKLSEIILPGERDGKIWMWHRCLKCPRTNGFPPATRRVVMSDAAWGLSLGKFLELSFSNHAAASRVASCGHSLHRDCLRFYGFGKMVACFRYASIDVHSVYLPPSKLDFNCENQERIQKETNEVVNQAELLFSEVLNAIGQIAEKSSGAVPHNNIPKTPESRRQISELEGRLQKEKAEFEELLQKTLNREVKGGQPAIDILEINWLRRRLLFQSYMWDHRLVYLASLDNRSIHNNLSRPTSEPDEKSLVKSEKLSELNTDAKSTEGSDNSDSLPVKLNGGPDNQSEVSTQEVEKGEGPDHGKEDEVVLSTVLSTDPQSKGHELRTNVSIPPSEGQIPAIESLSDTLDALWTGENNPVVGIPKANSFAVLDSAMTDFSSAVSAAAEGPELDNRFEDQNGHNNKISHSLSLAVPMKTLDNMEDPGSWLGMSFFNFYRAFNKNFLGSAQKLDTLGQYKPIYVSSFRESELQSGARLLLPVGVNDTVIPVYDDEPTSIISYALNSPEYHGQLANEADKLKDGGDFVGSLSFSDSSLSSSFDEGALETQTTFGSSEDGILSTSGSRSSLTSDPLSYTKALHTRVSFGDDGPLGKMRYSVTCYYAKRFEALRRICCPSEMDFVRSLSRCKKWGAQGGKSNVFFAKTLDDRFIIKQVTKTELESFIKFAPEYFKYLSESIISGSPTCLAKILGIYQVTTKQVKGGKETKMDVLVMENLLFGRNVTRLYDLKGSTRSRYNADSTGNNKVLLDQNLIEAMPTSPIFVGNKAKRLLERAVWNDTSFLASIDVMDYSLLVGIDEEKHELVLGIIDFMRQYTWDKHLETWVKASGILGGSRNAPPTVVSPKQYKKRFRKAMTTYFLMVPDHWSPPSIIPSKSQSDLCEENNAQGETGVE